jgi:hypothetical protein
VITNPWDQQTGESDEWHGRFVVYLGLGYGRTLSKAYKLVHPESEATEVSSAWRNEYRERKWRARATDHDLTLFHREARETAVILGRAMRAFAKKTLRGLLTKTPAMEPTSWEEVAKAFEVLWKMFPSETIHTLVSLGDETPAGKHPGAEHPMPEDFDANGFLKEIPEAAFPVHGGETPEQHLARTGFYPREKYVEPAPPAPKPPG